MVEVFEVEGERSGNIVGGGLLSEFFTTHTQMLCSSVIGR